MHSRDSPVTYRQLDPTACSADVHLGAPASASTAVAARARPRGPGPAGAPTTAASLTIARQLTEAGIERAQADALTDAIRQAAEHGDHVTAEQLRIEISSGTDKLRADIYRAMLVQMAATPRTRAGPRRASRRLDHAGPPDRARHQPLRGPGLRGRRHVDRTAAVVKMDSLAPTGPAAAELERPTPTARRLAAASISPNTRRAYAGALRRLDAWLNGRRLEDATLAAFVAELHDQGRAPASASTTVAAACFRARLARAPSPAGERTARVLAGYRRTAGDRGRGQTRPFGGVGPGRRPRHLRPAAAPRPRRRVRPGRPRARPPRRGDRRAPLHGGDAAERGEQAEYEAWRDGLPESLAESRTAELLEGVCDVDLDALDVELPRGFGRD